MPIGIQILRRFTPLTTRFLPPGEEIGRKHGIAIPATLAALDADQLALAVDIADFERCDFSGPEARAIGNAQCGA
jgi:hypothetical protein